MWETSRFISRKFQEISIPQRYRGIQSRPAAARIVHYGPRPRTEAAWKQLQVCVSGSTRRSLLFRETETSLLSPASSTMSTFNGLMAEFPDIRVDFFRQHADLRPPLACFLSHIHSDHLAGLESLRSPLYGKHLPLLRRCDGELTPLQRLLFGCHERNAPSPGALSMSSQLCQGNPRSSCAKVQAPEKLACKYHKVNEALERPGLPWKETSAHGDARRARAGTRKPHTGRPIRCQPLHRSCHVL